MINKHCYNYELKNYEKGIFDDFVDVTYILTMDNKDRMNNINKQLSNIIPTKKVYIVHNKGYKECNKNLQKYNSINDIVDANINILQHSVNNNYNNILILEDDFIFSNRLAILDKNIINEINIFIQSNNKNEILFNLGPIPIIFYPNLVNSNIFKNIFSTNAHSIIYNKNIKNKILENIKKYGIKVHWDVYLSYYNVYFYKYPLIYQTYPLTENRKIWFNINFINTLVDKSIKYINIDKYPEPGFTYIYNILFFINYLIWCLLLLLLLYFIYNIFIYTYEFTYKRFYNKKKFMLRSWWK